MQIVGYAQWNRLQSQLRKRGFSDVVDREAPICALQLGTLRVDFMPDDAQLLGFCNRWYKQAYENAQPYELDETVTIQVVSPVYFLATKLEAFKGRGGEDPLTSQDIEDVLILLDGRPVLLGEIRQASSSVRCYVAEGFKALLGMASMGHAIEATAQGDAQRSLRIHRTIDSVIELGAA